MKKILVNLILISILIPYVSADATGKNGLVVSSKTPASKIGIDVLKNGGNAIDAAIAVAFALSVTHPSAGNLGGGGFAVINRLQLFKGGKEYKGTCEGCYWYDCLDFDEQVFCKNRFLKNHF